MLFVFVEEKRNHSFQLIEMETNKNGVVKEEAEAPSSSSISSQNNETSNAEQKKSFLGFDDFNSFYEVKYTNFTF